MIILSIHIDPVFILYTIYTLYCPFPSPSTAGFNPAKSGNG
jgi:hypothetical protein